MATAQADDSSWAGWAISSFTKKLNTASGEIERVPTPNANSSSDARPASVPAMSTSGQNSLVQPKAASASTFSRQNITLPKPKSSFLDDDDNEDNDPDAWGDLDEENFFDAPVEPIKPKLVPITTATGKTTWDYEDTEPDISAMLNKSKSPLPKGLARKTPTATNKAAPRIGVGAAFSNGRGNAAAARQPVKTAGAFRPVAGGVAAKKSETKKAQDPWGNDDDDWGDAWDK